MAWGGDEAWRHIRPVHRSSWILSRPPADRKLWDSDFDPDVPIRVYILYIYPVHFVSARWTLLKRGRLSIAPLVSRSLSRPLPFSPGGCRQMLRFIEFRGTQSNYAAVYRDKPESRKEEIWRLRSGKRKVGEHELRVIFVYNVYRSLLRVLRATKEILFYRYKKENRLIWERLTRRIQSDFMRNILLIL